MILPRKNAWFSAWFAASAESRLRRTFGAARLEGLSNLRATGAARPVLIVSNHTSWWDPLVALWLVQRVARLDGYAMMDARNLRRLPFFGLVGAFGVDLADPRDGAVALRYAARHLDGPGKLVWVFPQGAERPEDPRPLGFQPGAAAIARLARGAAAVGLAGALLDRPGRVVWIFPQGRERPVTADPLGFRPGAAEVSRRAPDAAVVPLALRYAFRGAARPELLVHIGPPLEASDSTDIAAHERAVAAGLRAIDRALCAEPPALDGLEVQWAAGPGWLDRLATAALAWLTRRALPG